MEKIIEKCLAKYSHDINLDKKLIIDRMHKFQKYKEERREKERLYSIMAAFLIDLPDVPLIDIQVLTTHWEAVNRWHVEEDKKLVQVIDMIKKECRLNQWYFSFFDVPDLLVKKNLWGKDL